MDSALPCGDTRSDFRYIAEVTEERTQKPVKKKIKSNQKIMKNSCEFEKFVEIRDIRENSDFVFRENMW